MTVKVVKVLEEIYRSFIIRMLLARRGLWIFAASVTTILLLVGTLTNVLEPFAKVLPSRTHLIAHLIAHAVLAVSAMHIVPASVPAEVVCAGSIAAAFGIEGAQAAFVKDRIGDLGDVAAATVGSFAVFVFPRDGGSPIRPSWHALTSYVAPTVDEDEDDEDSHRVNSWAV